jgi:hypothetical protein
LHLDRIVASVEYEQRSGALLFLFVLMREAEKRFHLLGGHHLIGVLRRANTLHVDGAV